MTEYELTVPGSLLSSLLGEKDALAGFLEEVLNQVLEAQAAEQIGAGRYERSEERTAYRNGDRSWQLYTRVGPLAAGRFRRRSLRATSVPSRHWCCR